MFHHSIESRDQGQSDRTWFGALRTLWGPQKLRKSTRSCSLHDSVITQYPYFSGEIRNVIYADSEDIGVRQQGMMAYKVQFLEICEFSNEIVRSIGFEIIYFSDWKSMMFNLCCKNNTQFMNFNENCAENICFFFTFYRTRIKTCPQGFYLYP